MSISSLTYQYVSESFQNLMQISSSGDVFNGIGQQINNLNVSVDSSTSASYSSYSSVAGTVAVAVSAAAIIVNPISTDSNYSIVFTNEIVGSNPTTLSINGDSSSLKYNPSLDRLTVDNVSSSIINSNNVNANQITGSLFGTASYATYAESADMSVLAGRAYTVNIDGSVGNSFYKVLFADESGSAILKCDAESLLYNPSSNILYVSTVSSSIVSADTLSGNVIFGVVTGSLFGTSSWANNVISASYATTASHALNAGSAVAINNNTNNYLLTATGTANTINGESSLAFDGSTLILRVTGSLSNGFNVVADGYGSHAEGLNTAAGGDYSHAEGQATYIDINGSYAHAEGYNTSVTAAGGHAEGRDTSVSANYAHAEGYGTIANGQYQHVNGTFNVSSTRPGAVIIGNGTGTGARSNLLFASGSSVEITGSLKVTQGITGSLLGIASITNSIPTASVDLVTGSLYFDINTNMLYIYNGTSFKSASFF